jgi:hypothetical protein
MAAADDEVHQYNAAQTRKGAWRIKLCSTLLVLLAIGTTIGIAYYIETLKVESFQGYADIGSIESGSQAAPQRGP